MDYFISDTHFFHNRLLTFERRPFDNIKDHDETILCLLEQLHETDTLYHLGDFAFSNLDNAHTAAFFKRWSKLKCRKILIKGNHDKRSNAYYEKYFDEGYDKNYYYSRRIVLSHYPVPVTDGVLNVHGHLHGSIIDKPNYINANIHVQKYKLLTADDLDKKIGSLPVDNRRFLCEWFAPLQKFIEPRHDNLPLKEDGHVDFEKLAQQKFAETQ